MKWSIRKTFSQIVEIFFRLRRQKLQNSIRRSWMIKNYRIWQFIFLVISGLCLTLWNRILVFTYGTSVRPAPPTKPIMTTAMDKGQISAITFIYISLILVFEFYDVIVVWFFHFCYCQWIFTLYVPVSLSISFKIYYLWKTQI